MGIRLSEDETDDLLYVARTGENEELEAILAALAAREKTAPSEILAAARDDGGSTCLHMAAGNGHEVITSLLLNHLTTLSQPRQQAYLDAANQAGNTALHWAALGGHLGVVRQLVAAGALPALANEKNYVPLDLASFGDRLEVVDWLLAQGGGEGEQEKNGAGDDEDDRNDPDDELAEGETGKNKHAAEGRENQPLEKALEDMTIGGKSEAANGGDSEEKG